MLPLSYYQNLIFERMSKICDLCERRALKGNVRSHSNIATTHYQNLNLHTRKIGGVRKNVCTSCIKNLHRVSVKT